MKRRSQTEMKAELMKEAERVIDELMGWQAQAEQPNFSQIEEKVVELRQQLSEKMAAVTLSGQASVRPVPGPGCPKCQREMRYKGMKKNTVGSWVGEVSFERGYYYCDHCQCGLFPPGSAT